VQDAGHVVAEVVEMGAEEDVEGKCPPSMRILIPLEHC
jgi:hypothetical protein